MTGAGRAAPTAVLGAQSAREVRVGGARPPAEERLGGFQVKNSKELCLTADRLDFDMTACMWGTGHSHESFESSTNSSCEGEPRRGGAELSAGRRGLIVARCVSLVSLL